MRVAESLELPDALIRANEAGELVVFAGAGVSMGAPACLPSFEQLARQIAEGKVPWENRFANHLDEYLGHAAAAGVDVDARAREFLRRPGGHTTLHADLLGLFMTPERVRLITTNFDTHFTAAADVVFPRQPGLRSQSHDTSAQPCRREETLLDSRRSTVHSTILTRRSC